MKFRIIDSASVVALPVILSGSQTQVVKAQFVLDTGAANVMVSWKTVKLLGLNPKIEEERTGITTASGIEIVPLIYVPRISVLGCQAENVSVVIHDLPPQANVDGLLGLSFLKHFRLTVDFKAGLAELE